MSPMMVLHIIIRRGWIVGLCLVATLIGAVLVLVLVPPRFDAVATGSFDPNIVDPVSGLPAGAASISIVQGNLIALAKSNQVAVNVVKQLHMDDNAAVQKDYSASPASGLIGIQDWLAASISNNIDAKFGMGSNVLTLTYKASSARQAALMANAFMAAFVDAAIATKGSAAQKTADWFEPQIDKMREDVAAARQKLSEFQIASKLLAASTSDSENDQLVSVTNDLSQAKAALVSLESLLSSPATTAAASNDAPSLDLQALGALRSNLTSTDSDISKLQTDLGANNPKLLEKFATRKALQRQIDDLIGEFRLKLNDRIATQKEKIATLEKARAAQLQAMINVEGQRDRLAALKREADYRQDQLDRALKTSGQARLQGQLSFSNIAVIDVATPPLSAAFPKKIPVLGMGFALGLILGMLLALVAEAFDRRVRAGSDAEAATGAPLLGVLAGIYPNKPSLFARLTGRGKGGAKGQAKGLVPAAR